MLQRERRLHRPEDFERLRREGQAVHGRLLTLSYARSEMPCNRYGFIVSKRVGTAVVRNRVRRLMREAVRQLDSELEAGLDVVLIARASLAGQPLNQVITAVRELAVRAGVVQPAGKETPS